MPQDGILRGGDGGRAAAQDRPRAKDATRWLQHVLGDIGQSKASRNLWLWHCTENVFMFLVSFNGAEFPMRNQRRNANPPTL
jgi:hypothetical protein